MCAMKRESESVSASSAASSRGRNSDPDSAVDARTDGVSLLPRMRVWICSGAHEGVFGDGKWRLLNAIEKTQSLAAAAESLRMSYRKAWGDIRKAERTLGVALVTRHRGGSEGGSTELTDAGRRWIQRYSAFRKQVEDGMHRAFVECMKGLQSNHGD